MTKKELLTKLNDVLQVPSTTSVRAYDTVIKEAIRHIESEPEWIPVEEKLPEQHDSIFVGKKWIRWQECMWKKESDKVLVTVEKKDIEATVLTANTHDGEWLGEFGIIHPDARVTAWMPLPEPYKGEK